MWEDSEKVLLILNYDEVMEYYGDICYCGYILFYLVVWYGYWEIGFDFICRGVDKEVWDCFGVIFFYLVVCYN